MLFSLRSGLLMATKQVRENHEFQLTVYLSTACVILQIYLVRSYTEYEFHSAYNND